MRQRWSREPDVDLSQAVDVDDVGSAYVAGYTYSADFDTTAGAFSTTLQGVTDAFVSKLTPNGGGLAYSTYLGGPGLDPNDDRPEDKAWGIAVAPDGIAFVVGETASPDFPVTADGMPCILLNSCGGWVCGSTPLAYVTAVAPTGTFLVYSSHLGSDSGISSGIDGAEAVAVDSVGNAYVTGYTSSDGLAMAGAFDSQPDSIDAFVAKVAARQALLRGRLGLEIMAPQLMEPWEPAVFNFIIANTSPMKVADVAVKACFAGGELAFLESTAKLQVDGCCTVFSLGDIEADSTSEVAVTVVARETADYQMAARAWGAGGASNHSSVEIAVGAPGESGYRLPPWMLALLVFALVVLIWMVYRRAARARSRRPG